MNKDLVEVDFGKQLADLSKMQETCKQLLQTKHYAAIGEAGIHAIIARAKALGIHPFEALNGGFICIQGKVGMSTEMMAALVRQRGHSIQKDPKSNAEICILHGKRADNGDTWTCTFSKEDAITAGLWNGPTWKKYPGIMLYNRCMSQLFRQLFPDISLGAGYVEDELKEIGKVEEYKGVEIEVKAIEEEKPKVETISKEQTNVLIELMKKCPPGYEDHINKYLKDLNIESVEMMPVAMFEVILIDANTQSRKFQNGKSQAE